MKKDIKFIKELLSVFEQSIQPHLNHSEIMDILEYDYSIDEDNQWFNKYYHHINLLYDSNCIKSAGQHTNDTGFIVSVDGRIAYGDIPMRITENGHSLLVALNNDTIWNKLTTLGGKITSATLIEAGKKITAISLEQLFN